MSTIVYADVSGSMTGVMKDKLIAKLNSFAVSGLLKGFDDRVHPIGPYNKTSIERLRATGGGGSDLTNVIKDFKASGATKAIIVTDGYFFHDNALDMTGVQIITIPTN